MLYFFRNIIMYIQIVKLLAIHEVYKQRLLRMIYDINPLLAMLYKMRINFRETFKYKPG
jgi:hypothetical protein